jgi:hypothetical protein
MTAGPEKLELSSSPKEQSAYAKITIDAAGAGRRTYS